MTLTNETILNTDKKEGQRVRASVSFPCPEGMEPGATYEITGVRRAERRITLYDVMKVVPAGCRTYFLRGVRSLRLRGGGVMEDLEAMVRAEFKLLGAVITERNIKRLVEVLEAQNVDFGEVGVSAACLGFAVGRGSL